ncbi:hypothetical protein BC643_4317 [Mangrovibacterium diazotrophicum]|uniref:Uncharacterized protein n=1 Tax=Mangrovibacterium diazotrophicum TaxID=1261403 RepID=A0A419VV53_9BACT|nr:hypothetical protein BC643_4317 [Mangrovibacterium diazotrophicum]
MVKSEIEAIKIAYSFPISHSDFIALWHRGLFIEDIVTVIGLVGLCFRKNIGYILVSILPYFSIGLFFLLRKQFYYNWTMLVFPIFVIILINTSLTRNYFHIKTVIDWGKNLLISVVLGIGTTVLFRFIIN